MGSDHCPYPRADKIPGETNIWNAPNGIPGVETSLKAMLNGISEGRTTLNRIVECFCENPAKLYGLFPRKGHIEVGADADIVILDMDKVETIKNENIVSKCGWSAFEGKTFKGAADTVFLRGKIIAEKGTFKGDVGYGKFLSREKSCLK